MDTYTLYNVFMHVKIHLRKTPRKLVSSLCAVYIGLYCSEGQYKRISSKCRIYVIVKGALLLWI